MRGDITDSEDGTSREFLGTGWAFPVRADSQRRVELDTGEADIDAAIRLILGTAKGERVMRPNFGCGIHDFVFTTVNTATLTLIEDSVRTALQQWEPRIEVNEIDVSAAELNVGRLRISIDYTVRQTNNEYNLVYPFYLEDVKG